MLSDLRYQFADQIFRKRKFEICPDSLLTIVKL